MMAVFTSYANLQTRIFRIAHYSSAQSSQLGQPRCMSLNHFATSRSGRATCLHSECTHRLHRVRAARQRQIQKLCVESRTEDEPNQGRLADARKACGGSLRIPMDACSYTAPLSVPWPIGRNRAVYRGVKDPVSVEDRRAEMQSRRKLCPASRDSAQVVDYRSALLSCLPSGAWAPRLRDA